MSNGIRIGVIFAIVFSVWGDFYLKRYGDKRAVADLDLCLALWTVSTAAWVVTYQMRATLGRTTALGAALGIIANTSVGVLAFGEKVDVRTAAGLCAALVGIALLG